MSNAFGARVSRGGERSGAHEFRDERGCPSLIGGLLPLPWVGDRRLPRKWRAEAGEREHREGDQRAGRVKAVGAAGDHPDLGVDRFDTGV